MNKSTTQTKNNQKEETKATTSDLSNASPFEVEIQKKIRNKQKKLREIMELKEKAKAKDFTATD